MVTKKRTNIKNKLEVHMKIYIEKKKIKREVDIGRNRYMNMSEKEKQKLRKSQKIYCNEEKVSIEKFSFFGVE